MKIYFDQRLLVNNDILGVEEANGGKIQIIIDENDYSILVGRNNFTKFSISELQNTEFDLYWKFISLPVNEPITINLDKIFISPGSYQISFLSQTFSFTVRPSGEAYCRMPSLLKLPNDLMRLIASSDNMSICVIWDLSIPTKHFATDYFWKSLVTIRLTENLAFLNQPLISIFHRLHELDNQVLSSVPTFGERVNIEHFSQFEKWRERYLNLGRFFYFFEQLFNKLVTLYLVDSISETLRMISLLFKQLFPSHPFNESSDDNPGLELNQWRVLIYQEIIQLLSPTQIHASILFLNDIKDKTSLPSRELMELLVASAEPSFRETIKIDLDEYPSFIETVTLEEEIDVGTGSAYAEEDYEDDNEYDGYLEEL